MKSVKNWMTPESLYGPWNRPTARSTLKMILSLPLETFDTAVKAARKFNLLLISSKGEII